MENLHVVTAYRHAPPELAGGLKHFETEAEIAEKTGVSLYRQLMWTVGKIRVYRYTRREPAPIQTPTLMLYALADRERLTDLKPSASFVRTLLQQGMDVYSLEWGIATRSDRLFTLHDYINEFLDEVVNHIQEKTGMDKINLLGVGHGGVMGAIYSAIHPQKVKNLVTVLTPIDFSASDGTLFGWSAQTKATDQDSHQEGRSHSRPFHGAADLAPAGKVAGKPQEKPNTLVQLIEEKQKLLSYLRVGNWFYGHLPQSGECFRQLVEDLHHHNKLMKGTLQVGPYKVNLRYITMPVLNICPENDALVPLAAALPFNNMVGSRDKAFLKLQVDEVGKNLVCKEIGAAVAGWLKKRDRD